MNTQQLIEDVKRHEGWSPTVYEDTEGYWTIGYGFLVDPAKRGAGLSEAEGEFILHNRLQERIVRLESDLDFFEHLSDARQRALVNMSYQLGVEGLYSFENMLTALAEGDCDRAADEALDSRWAEQTPNRAEEIADIIRFGND